MRLVKIEIDGIRLFAKSMFQVMIMRRTFCQLFYESGYFLTVFIAPRILVGPVPVELYLYVLHLLTNRLFGILLHTAVYGGVYFQSVRVEIYIVLVTPFLE